MKMNLVVAIIATILNSALALHLGVGIGWWLFPVLALGTFIIHPILAYSWVNRHESEYRYASPAEKTENRVYSIAISSFIMAVGVAVFTVPNSLGFGFFLIELASFATASGWFAPRRSDASDEPGQ